MLAVAEVDGLPLQEMRRNANRCMTEAIDWLNTTWDPEHPPTDEQRAAWEFARKCAGDARQALFKAAARR